MWCFSFIDGTDARVAIDCIGFSRDFDLVPHGLSCPPMAGMDTILAKRSSKFEEDVRLTEAWSR